MKLHAILATLLLVVVATGCWAAPFEVDKVYIEQYVDFEWNFRHTQEIVAYGPEYLAAKVPAYDELVSSSITYGAGADSFDTRRALVYIRYDLGNPTLLSRKDDLIPEMRAYFLWLSESQANMSSLYYSRGPIRLYWIDEVFSDSPEKLYNDLSPMMKATLPPEEWQELCRGVKKDFGSPLDIGFMMGQFYEAFDSFPEMLSLFYVVEFEGGKKLQCRVSETNESGNWEVIGLKWYR